MKTNQAIRFETGVHGDRPLEPAEVLLRDLRSRDSGLSSREAERRLTVYGRNELRRGAHEPWYREVVRQVVHPLALLLWAAAALSFAGGTPALGYAIVAVVVLNAAFAFAQERRAERAVAALAEYLPPTAVAHRDGMRRRVDVRELVPGDVIELAEGDRVPADARLLEGAVDIDMSALTGESVPVSRSAGAVEHGRTPLESPRLVFSGGTCTSGTARAVVFHTGMRTELGRVAALSTVRRRAPSPLELQVKRVAWLIVGVALGFGVVFLTLGVVVAGLPGGDALRFALGLLVANVPEGLLPTITLALALGVRMLASDGAVVKRLSAVETLGSTTVICTDKTGTLTQNRMRVVEMWVPDRPLDMDQPADGPQPRELAETLAACNDADLSGPEGLPSGDPTEVALLLAARALGTNGAVRRRAEFRFDPALRRMSTVDNTESGLAVHVKGAPEAVLGLCTTVLTGHDEHPLSPEDRMRAVQKVADLASSGLRVLAVARRRLGPGAQPPQDRDVAERDLTLLGLVALLDPPRPEVAGAVATAHAAGIRIIVVTGDHPLTAAEVARRIGLRSDYVATGADLAGITDAQLERVLAEQREIIFARTSPEDKLRIVEALRALGETVAVTGDGVNDAPALHRADIGVAMGQSGTDVAREAATMTLTDDNFGTIVRAVEAGRQVYANVRKFVVYIFAHLVPEVIPFLVFALSGGAVPLPLTVLQILAIDLGTETLPALALGREPAEPGLMTTPPRPRREGVITPGMLVRAWAVMGVVSAALVLAAYFAVLLSAGWSPGAAVGKGSALHEAYLRATTMVFAGIVACQVGTAFAARTDRASLRTVGLRSNRFLLWSIAAELAFTAAIVYLPPLQSVFGTAGLGVGWLFLLAPFPVLVWGADELYRAARRPKSRQPGPSVPDAAPRRAAASGLRT